MATTYYNDIQKLYVAYFNRPADPAGLAYWETVVEGAKGSTAAVSASFAASAEYKAAYANMTNTQIVTAVYQNLFGHAPDAAGLKYWADLLDAKTTTIDAVVTNIAGGAQTTDLIAYTAKVTAASAFTAALDTDAEKAGYTGDAANKIGKTFLAGVTDSISLASATSTANLNATVASAVAAGTPFSVAGSLAQIETAQKAVDTFVTATVTKDVNGDGVKNATDIDSALTKAKAAVVADLTDASAKTLFNSTTSADVRNALIGAQQTTNAGLLSDAQKNLAADNTEIAKVTGLSEAISAVASAKTSLKAAQTAELSAKADFSAKNAAFAINNGVNGTASTTVTKVGSNLVFTPAGGSSTTLATVDATTGKATLVTGLDATKYVGLTDLIASYNADQTALANVDKAQTNLDASLLVVNLLDLGPTGTAINGTYANEKALLDAIVAKINATSPDTVATGAVPTAAQIQTELAVLNAKTDKTEYNAFKALIDLDKADVAKLTTDLNAAVAADTAAQAKVTTTGTALTTAETNFAGGPVTASATALTIGSGAGATTLANIDSTGTKKATLATGITETTNPGVTDLIAKYNANVDAVAAAATAATAKSDAQTAYDAVASLNPLVKVQAGHAATVDAITTAISTLSKDVAALQAASANSDTLAGLKAAVQGYSDALVAKGYNAVTLDDAHTINFATAKSDIYIVSDQDASIAAFGLQGSDSLFVGTGYTMVKGSLTGTSAVKGSDAALEIFVSQSGADTVLQVESHAYSSSVTGTGTGEIVTITLTGVDASTIKLDTTGIISTGTAAA